eukprot:357060-Chlamydomonas_euryale.AAC.2
MALKLRGESGGPGGVGRRPCRRKAGGAMPVLQPSKWAKAAGRVGKARRDGRARETWPRGVARARATGCGESSVGWVWGGQGRLVWGGQGRLVWRGKNRRGATRAGSTGT